MNLISDDRASAFGLFLFFVLVATSVTMYAIEKPVMDDLNAAFGDDYRNEYMNDAGKDSVEQLYFIFNSVLVLFTVIFGAIMVINRAILEGEL